MFYIRLKTLKQENGESHGCQNEHDQFDFLRKLALELGASDAKIIPAKNSHC